MPPLKGEDTCEHVERVSAIAWSNGAYKATEALEAENARLKAEVEELQRLLTASTYYNTSDEVTRLKAEVERLTLENSQYEEHHKYGQNVITSLREEVEQLTVARNYFIHKMMQKIKEVDRLTKAGDAFYESEIGYYGEQILNDPKHHSGQMCRDWNAAKEGKPRA